MISNLLGTKLHRPPPPSKLVQRTNLVHTLMKNLEVGRFLTLVSAPAGFGKTTLVSEWVSSLHLPVAWLSLDRADDDPGQFFAYFIAALQKVNENIGREIESVLHSGQLPSSPAIATSLVNDILAAGVHFIIVLDDFQVIQDRAILEVLETILAKPPEQMHLVLITREDPLLPLSRLRGNNQMWEIRAQDLRFKEHEVGLFLNGVMGLSLSEADVAAMENRTEGWAAGLQLAAIAMHDRADLSSFITHLSGSHRYILSYLTEEVLSRQTNEIQIFLSQTSILDKLCGELCDAVTARTDSRALLEKCFHANLFLIALDDEGRWYRYHHLFRDLLLNQQSRIPEQDILELHRRASQWYEEAGMISESVEHALVAANYQHAVQLLEDHAQGMIMQGYMKTVEGWMQDLPSEWQSHNPKANLAFAWMYLLRGNYERVPPYLQHAREAIWGIDPGDGVNRPLRAEWLSLQATFMNVLGKIGQSIELANQALQWTSTEDYYVKSLAYSALGGGYRLMGNYKASVEAFQLAIQNSRAGGHPVPEMLAVGELALMAIQHGQLHFAYEAGSQALDRLERGVAIYSPMAGAVYATLGLICYHWNQLDQASSYLLRSIQLSSLSGHNAGVVYAKVILSRVYHARRDSRAAVRTIREAIDLMPFGIPAWLKPDIASHLARFYLDQGNPSIAETVLKQLGISIPEGLVLPDPLGLSEPLTQLDGLKSILSLRLLLNQVRIGQRLVDLPRGIDLAGCLVSRALSNQRIEIVLPALLLRAQMYDVQGNLEASLADLRQAVELAEPEGYERTFLDEGQAVAALLRLSLEQPIQPGERQANFIRHLLASSAPPMLVSSRGELTTRPGSFGLQEKLVEPLTDRELDVIRLMAEGLKYQEIAGRLFITLNTVRFYVKEIYSKLNVNNRTQAIEAAHKHNLL
jgi:LuxR family maltose regulon positive regulatory protein